MARKRSRDSDLHRQNQRKCDTMPDPRQYPRQQERQIHKDVDTAIREKTFYVETPALHAATWDEINSTSQDVRERLFLQGSDALRFHVRRLHDQIIGKQGSPRGLWDMLVGVVLSEPTLFQLSKKVRHGHLHTVTGGDVKSATRGFCTWVGGMLEEEKGFAMVATLVDAVFLPLLKVAKESHDSFARASKRPRLQQDDAEEVLFLHRFYTVMVAKKRVKPNPPPPSPSAFLVPVCSEHVAAPRSSTPAPVAYSSPDWRPQSTPRSARNDTPMNFQASPPWGEDEDLSSRDPRSFTSTQEHNEFGRESVPFSPPTFTPFVPFAAAATHAPGFPELTAPPPAALPGTLASPIRLSSPASGDETSLRWLKKSASADNYEGDGADEDGDWDMDLELQYPPGVDSSCSSPSMEPCQDAMRGPTGLAMALTSLRNSG
ncbi:hypothetical protein FB45DRAFT_918539 [Roridomyces roridus]|uniref:Uncharacterized protein n=1 Tax=Roridomyces roridus TaxID=1738132 RepID=A0AAD7FJR8_9AGAR|nr:hypothetical protein FB45DRAFT_918539 [Roridomyces roridus]